MSLPALAAQVFTGLVLGGIFVLLAIGLSLIFGLMTVVNFSHGALYMLGAYFGFMLLGLTGSFWAALVLAPLLVGAFGLVIERFLIRPLYGRSPDDPLLLTFGLSLVLVEVARLIWGKTFEGVVNYMERMFRETDSDWLKDEISRFMSVLPCPTCKGARLKNEVLAVKVND
ncbi:MAG: hypothetical protein AAB387_11585, partial [candidate division NC10 bacterium]